MLVVFSIISEQRTSASPESKSRSTTTTTLLPTHRREPWHTSETPWESLSSTRSATTLIHEASEATIIVHLLREEHLKYLVWVEAHAPWHAATATHSTGHSSHIEVHASREATAARHASIIHVVHTHAHVVLFTLLGV